MVGNDESKISDAVDRSAAERGVELPPTEAPLPIFEGCTSTLYYSNDGALRVLPIQYGFGKPTFEVRNDGEPVLCTHERVLADAYIAGYDLATDAGGLDAVSSAPSIQQDEWDALAAVEQRMYSGMVGIFPYTDVMPYSSDDPIAALWQQCEDAVGGECPGDEVPEMQLVAHRVAVAQACIAFGPELALELGAKVKP